MNEREHEQATEAARRQASSEVRKSVARAPAQQRSDVRIHADTGAGTLARALAAGAAVSHLPAPAAGDGVLARQLAHSVGERAVARDFIDDIKTWWGGDPKEEAKRVERKEVPITKQDFNQILGLVFAPLSAAEQMLAGDSDVAKAKAALAKVTASGKSLSIIAETKKEPKNRDNLYTPLNEIGQVASTLAVMSEPDKAQDVWQEQFKKAMTRVDDVLALPIRDESGQGQQGDGQQQQQGQPAGDPNATLTQRDHDLVVAGLKPQLQTLIDTTKGTPYVDWDPKVVAEDHSVSLAAGAFSNRMLLEVGSRVERGLQAIKTFTMSLDGQRDEAVSKLQSAQVKVSLSMESYTGADPTDPTSPTYTPPEPPQ